MTERQYQLMARSAGAQLLRSQGGQLYPRASARDSRALDPYSSPSYAQNPAQFGGRSDYYLPSDSRDMRAQLISERRSALPGNFIDRNLVYAETSEPRVLSARAGAAELFPYHSPQHAIPSQASPSAFGAADLLRARRAEIISAYSPTPGGGGRMGRLGSLGDSVVSKEGLMTAGAYLNAGQRRLPLSYEEQDPRLAAGQHGVLGSGAATSQARDIERYLLAVQPEKLVRYAAGCLSPEPAIKRARYAMMANNVAPPPELDVYSNYRQAKLRRSGAVENRARQDMRTDRTSGARSSGTTSGVRSDRREKEKEPNRERRRKSDDNIRGSEKKSDSPKHESRHDPVAPKDDDGNRDQSRNRSQVSGGGHRASGKKQGNAGPKRPSARTERSHETGQKEDNHVDSDKDSELGSLGADLSDFEDDYTPKNKNAKKKVSEEPEAVIDAPLDGMIFGCSSVTFYECMRLQLFALPSKNKDEVMRVTPGTKLFLFNFDTKELSGIFEAVSHGGLMLQPDAFREFGSFPAQVQVCCVEQCPNIHLTDFKNAIKDNFVSAFKFKFSLTAVQVKDLVRLFRRAARLQPQIERREEGGLFHRYIHDSISSEEEYLLRNSQHQRQTYTQHPQASFGLSSISYARVVPLSTKSKVPEQSSRKARAGRRKKRKVEKDCPQFPTADNCSPLKQPEEKGDTDIAKNASKPREDDDTSNTNLSVLVGKVIVTDNSKNFCQHKEIVEAIDAISDSKGSDPPEPGPEIGTSKPGEFPGLQSDHEDCDGKQVSLVEDSSNDGKCGLAGGRSEEQGKGLNVQKGALDNDENVIKESSDCCPPSSGVHEGLSIVNTPQLLFNLGSSPKDDKTVAGEVPNVDKLELPLVGTSDDGLDVEGTEESENLEVGCSASFWTEDSLKSPVKDRNHLVVDSPEEEDGDIVCAQTDDGKRAVETGIAESAYTITTVSDSCGDDQTEEGEKGISEQLVAVSECKTNDLEPLTSKQEEVPGRTEQDKSDDGQSCEFTNLEMNRSDENILDSCRSDNLMGDTECMSADVAEDEEMVDIDYDDIHCEVPKIEILKVMEKVERVEKVSEAGDRCVPNVEVVMEIDDGAVKGEGIQRGNTQAMEAETDSAYCKYTEAEDEEDAVDYESSSEVPQTSDSAGEDEDELLLVEEVSSETPDEGETEEEEQVLELESPEVGETEDEEQVLELESPEVTAICERPETDDKVELGTIQKNISLPVREGCKEGDLTDTVNADVNYEQEVLDTLNEDVNYEGEVLGQQAQSVNDEEEKVDDVEAKSEETENRNADSE